jgi:serine/threonine protein kinase
MPLSKGDQLGPYRIVALIGEGGMGKVYRAIDTHLDRTVAIKIVNGDLRGRDQIAMYLASFRERDLTGRMA